MILQEPDFISQGIRTIQPKCLQMTLNSINTNNHRL